jgi:hypothetical protein
LILIGAVLALVPLLAQAGQGANTLPPIRVKMTKHVDHPEATFVRRCPDGGNPFMLYKHKQEDTWYILCQIKEAGDYAGKWSLRPSAKDIEGWFEKSAYIPKDGTWEKVVIKYLENFATRWRQPLP